MITFNRSLLLLCSALSSYLLASEYETCGPRPYQVKIRHIEPDGIGFTKGYSSLDLSLSCPSCDDHLVSFLDLRGHVFNDGKFAVNTGLALRWLPECSCRVWGINLFYDYRQTHKRPYNQISMGLEALGERWDFRVDGYLPVGAKRSRAFDFSFDFFPDNSFLLTGKRELAMKGIDAEAGYHFTEIDAFDLYAAIGPYFYAPGKFGDNTVGGRLRLLSTICTYLTLEAALSYDHIFKWIGQGALSLNFPFGPRKRVCCDSLLLEERLYQPIWHNEIIVIDRHRHKL